jgi:hypothetical protein
MTTLKLGKRPATYDHRDLRFSDVRSGVSLPHIPKPGGGYGMDFGATGWLMLGNGPCDDGSVTDQSSYAYQGAGDCAWAGPGHETMEFDKNAGRPVAKFTCKNILDQYAQYLGLKDASELDSNNDQGSDVREVLSWRQSKGLLDASGNAHKIGTYVSIEPGNVKDLWDALWLFDAVGIGINFPGSAMDQFNQGKPWSVVPGAQIEGGHYIPLVGHPTNDVWTCVTWGQRQTLTQQFLTTYCEEAWAYITPERYNAVTGKSPQGWRDVDLQEYITLVGQKVGA